MHELSIAGAILDVARSRVPANCALKTVRVIAGPMRAIEPQAMQFAWEAVLDEEQLTDIQLELKLLPWLLHCPACHREWSSKDLQSACVCGCKSASPIDGDELQVSSIEVDDILERACP
ncbi:MAG TPA: hydrogenase maturation nickel metallochaperone HypA [Tepidisphaeraceae bacterium]|nr:hydrogenase maturation nickel metallochaperone HypA [Tepidisphaeraceae bacterium]